jgi:hypothetical protein
MRIRGEARGNPHVIGGVAGDEIVDPGEREHPRALPAAHEAAGQRDDGQVDRQRVETRIAA